MINRRLGLLAATSANMLEMIGIGPFITIPLLISSMNGPQAMLGWVLGALVAVCDGLVWAELGAAMPESGGPYRYLLEAYGPRKLGRLMSFLFLWQMVASAPLGIGSGAVGFAQYAKFLWPSMTAWDAKFLAMGVCLLATALLYREIQGVGRLSVAMWSVVLATAAWITVAGLSNFRPDRVFDFPPGAFHLSRDFFAGLGGATLIAMYDYGGYNNVCYFAGEVKNPARTIPRSIMLAIAAVAGLYLVMNVTIVSVVPWREAARSTAIVSDFIVRLYGTTAAKIMTGLILWTAFASLFAALLGYSRVPYRAAVDGRFFRPFARLHPTKNFPSVSLLVIGIASAAACLLELDALIKALVAVQVLTHFLAQVVAVTLLRRYRPDIQRPFQMWLYPFSSLVAFGGWAFILVSSGIAYVGAGLGLAAAGIAGYMWRAKAAREWPFES